MVVELSVGQRFRAPVGDRLRALPPEAGSVDWLAGLFGLLGNGENLEIVPQ